MSLTGVVLCGGKSRRMGADKGLLKLDTFTWAGTAVDKLNSLDIPVVISINKDQRSTYSSLFDASQLIIDSDLLQIQGPLLGVLSIHLSCPTDDLFVLGCDLPLMERDLLKELKIQYDRQPGKDAFIYTNDGEAEPLCGIYTSKGLTHVRTLLENERLQKHSMKFMLDQIDTCLTPVPVEKKNSFRNFNAYAELNGL